VRAEEGRVWGDVNAAALGRWGGGKGGLEEKVGLLDGVLGAVWGMGEKGGRYNRVVRRFEIWMEGVRDVVTSRDGGVGKGMDVEFVSDLDAGWKGECEGLARKLGECRDVIGVLGRVEGESSLARILSGTDALVEDMLAGLDLMLAIEREAVARENDWVRSVNREGDGEDDTPRAGAIWRAF